MTPATMTDLERGVFADIVEGRGPWHGNHGVGSRRVSQAIGRLFRKGFLSRDNVPMREGLESLDEWLRPMREARLAFIVAEQRAGITRIGAGDPHAWFCLLGRSLDKTLTCCARCGSIMPRDSSRWAIPCVGVVTVEMRGGR